MIVNFQVSELYILGPKGTRSFVVVVFVVVIIVAVIPFYKVNLPE